MTIYFQYKSDGGTGQTAEFAKVAMRVGVCTLGTAGALYKFDPGQDPTATLGFGPLPMADARAARLAPNAQRYALKVAATTAGTIGSVTKSGAGPTVTVTALANGIDALSSPFIAAKLRAKVIRAGGLGIGRIAVALDGASYLQEFDIPTLSKGTVIGTVDLTTLSLPSALDTLTLVFDTENPNVDQTVTFSAPATIAAVVSQINAAATTVEADVVQGKFLRIRRKVAGPGKTLAITAGSTAETVLGLSTDQVEGGPATLTLPGTGLVMGFADGTYVLNELYSCDTTAPRCSFATMLTAIQAAVDAEPTLGFGLLVICQDPTDEGDFRNYVDQLDAMFDTWEASDDRRYVIYLVNSPMSTANTADAADKSALLTHVSKHGAVASRDCYMVSALPQPPGTFRAMLVEQLAIRCVQQPRFSDDVGWGDYGPLECKVKGPDGTLARNEATATVKLGGSKGPGFTVLTSKSGLAYFKRGVTRAGANSRFVHLGVLRATKVLAQVLYGLMQRKENATFELNANGTIFEPEAVAIEGSFEEPCNELLVRPQHFSRVIVRVDRAEKISTSNTLKLAYQAQMRGQGEIIEGTLVVSGTIITTEG